jgi:hypothetical protein
MCNDQIIKWNLPVIGYYIVYRWYEDDGGTTKESTVTVPGYSTTLDGVTITAPSTTVKYPAKDADDEIGICFVDYDSSNEKAWSFSNEAFTFWTKFY